MPPAITGIIGSSSDTTASSFFTYPRRSWSDVAAIVSATSASYSGDENLLQLRVVPVWKYCRSAVVVSGPDGTVRAAEMKLDLAGHAEVLDEQRQGRPRAHDRRLEEHQQRQHAE